MKKKLLTVISVILVAAALSAAIAYFAPKTESEKISEKGVITLVIASDPQEVYSLDLDKITGNKGLLSVLEYLKETEGLNFVSEESGYGAFITEVGGLSQDNISGVYLYIYTSVEADFDVSGYALTVTCEGKTLTSAGVGANEMTLTDGCVIYIGIIVYN